MADKARDVGEIVYYNDSKKGAKGRNMKDAPDEEEFAIQLRGGSRGSRNFEDDQGVASGKIYQIDKAPSANEKKKKIHDPTDFLARQEYYQHMKAQNIQSIKKEMQKEEKGHADGIPVKMPTKPRPSNKRIPTADAHQRSRSKEYIPGDEELTFQPKINSSNLSKRTYEDQMNWLKQREEKLSLQRVGADVKANQDNTFRPRISSKSRDIANERTVGEDGFHASHKSKQDFVKNYLEKEKQEIGRPRISKSPRNEERTKRLVDEHNGMKYYQAQAVKKPSQPAVKASRKNHQRSVSPEDKTEDDIIQNYRSAVDPKARSKSKDRQGDVWFQDEDIDAGYLRGTATSKSRSARKGTGKRGRSSSKSKERAPKSARKQGVLKNPTKMQKPASRQEVTSDLPIKTEKLQAAASKLNGGRPNSNRKKVHQSPSEELMNHIISEASQHHRKHDATNRLLQDSPNKSNRKNKSPIKSKSREHSPDPATKDFDTKYWINKQRERNAEKRERNLIGLIYKDQLGVYASGVGAEGNQNPSPSTRKS